MRFSIEAEQSIIGGLLFDNCKFEDVSEKLAAEDFYHVDHVLIFKAMAALFQNSQPFDTITISEKIEEASGKDQLGYLLEIIQNTPSAANILAYVRIVSDRAMERTLAEAGQRVCEIAEESTQSVDDKIAAVHSELAALERKETAEVVEFNNLLKGEVEYIDRKFHGKVAPGLQIGFSNVDVRFGGLEPSDLWVLAARPSMGKTTLALNIAYNIAQSGQEVLIFSLEMSKEQLTKKLLSAASGISYGKLRSGELKDENWSQLSAGVSHLKDKKIHIIDIAGLDITRATAIARKFTRHGRVGLIMIDYLQLMTDRTTKSRFDEVSNVSRKLKSMAKMTNTPVLALSQLSRKVEERSDKRPQMSDLRESGQIEQDADIISFLYRDDVYDQGSHNPNTAELNHAKFRNGETGTDYLRCQLHRSRFVEVEHDYSPVITGNQPKQGGFR